MSDLKRYEMSVSATDFDGYQIFACFAESEQDAISKFKSGKSEIIESQVEVIGLEGEPDDVYESGDISSRLSGDIIKAKDARIAELKKQNKRMKQLISNMDEYLDFNNITSISATSSFHRQMKELLSKGGE